MQVKKLQVKPTSENMSQILWSEVFQAVHFADCNVFPIRPGKAHAIRADPGAILLYLWVASETAKAKTRYPTEPGAF